MAHCHPVLMVQSLHQAPDLQLVQQSYAPDVFVMLALTQQHPNSQHLGKKPGQCLAALVLTRENMFVGTSIGPTEQVQFLVVVVTEVCFLLRRCCAYVLSNDLYASQQHRCLPGQD